MPGGGQPGNQNAAKWTEEKALNIAHDLINWMNEVDESGEDKGNIFFKEFLMKNDLYQDLIDYLCDKYMSFSELIKKAKEIQEYKIVKYGITDRLQPAMTIFTLKNLHNWKDKRDVTSGGDKITGFKITIEDGDS